MTPAEYITALYKAGVRENLPIQQLDREAARILGVDERTARRYRNGETKIPRPVSSLLKLLERNAA